MVGTEPSDSVFIVCSQTVSEVQAKGSRDARIWKSTDVASTRTWLTYSPRATRSDLARKQPPFTQLMVPLVVSGFSCDAAGDYGIDENAVSLAEARELNMQLDLRPSSCEDFVAGNNKPFRSIGKAYATCSFTMAEPTNAHQLSFHVFKQLPEPLLIGRRDLEATSTLANHGYRLVEKAFDPRVPVKVLAFHRPTEHLRASLNGFTTDFMADTGAQLNLVQPYIADFAATLTSGMWEEDFWIRFADCSVAHVSEPFDGTVKPMSNDGDQHDVHTAPFYVCEDLFCPAILGASTLEDMDAFRKLRNCFVTPENKGSHDTAAGFNLIVRLTDHEQKLLEHYSVHSH